MDMADYHLALLLIRQGAFEVAQEVLLRVALKVRTNPEMSFAAGLACLRMPILPNDVPENQRDVVTMAGKAFWDLAPQAPDNQKLTLKPLLPNTQMSRMSIISMAPILLRTTQSNIQKSSWKNCA